MSITLDSNKSFRDISKMYEAYPVQTEKAAALAVNEAARFGRAESTRIMRSQVNLPVRYIGERLIIDQRASPGNLVARISGRRRPTSLLRFTTGIMRHGRSVKVKVKAGGVTKEIPGAFKIKLLAGKDLSNEGLAIRLKPGKTLSRGKGVKIREDKYGTTYALYGPSVDQVFRTVRDDVTPPILNRLNSEFDRQFRRLTNG